MKDPEMIIDMLTTRTAEAEKQRDYYRVLIAELEEKLHVEYTKSIEVKTVKFVDDATHMRQGAMRDAIAVLRESGPYARSMTRARQMANAAERLERAL